MLPQRVAESCESGSINGSRETSSPEAVKSDASFDLSGVGRAPAIPRRWPDCRISLDSAEDRPQLCRAPRPTRLIPKQRPLS